MRAGCGVAIKSGTGARWCKEHVGTGTKSGVTIKSDTAPKVVWRTTRPSASSEGFAQGATLPPGACIRLHWRYSTAPAGASAGVAAPAGIGAAAGVAAPVSLQACWCCCGQLHPPPRLPLQLQVPAGIRNTVVGVRFFDQPLPAYIQDVYGREDLLLVGRTKILYNRYPLHGHAHALDVDGAKDVDDGIQSCGVRCQFV